MGAGIAEIGQHPVAHIFGDKPVEASDNLGNGTMVCADNVAQILGVKTLGQGCRPDEIAEHDGQLPPLCLGPGPSLCGMRGSPRMAAPGGRSGSRERAAIGGRDGWNWIRRRLGSAELGNGFEQLAPVADRCNANLP